MAGMVEPGAAWSHQVISLKQTGFMVNLVGLNPFRWNYLWRDHELVQVCFFYFGRGEI